MRPNKYRGLELLKFCESDCGARGKAPKFSTRRAVINRIHNRRTAFPQLWMWKTLAAVAIWSLTGALALELIK